jgi:hypothetical protein
MPRENGDLGERLLAGRIPEDEHIQLGRHVFRIIIAYTDSEPQHAHNESVSYSGSACAINFNTAGWSGRRIAVGRRLAHQEGDNS